MKILCLMLFCVHLIICSSLRAQENLSDAAIIPKPVSVTSGQGRFIFSDKSRILIYPETAEMKKIGEYLSEKLNQASGVKSEINSFLNTKPGNGDICLNLLKDDQLGEEGYQLEITDSLVTLHAVQSHGLFNGVQTLLQLIPVKDSVKQGSLTIASGRIRDYPEYAYRGIMLDVARHFFPVKDIKRMIDLSAIYKINYLHLHLSDDQGWRIEIKKWPKLAKIGGQTQVGGGEGGYYTQKQYIEIVNYAAEHYITVVPEIDMPGHTNAALVSYPELNCSKRVPKLYTGKKVGFSSLCTSRDVTYKFVKDVLKELADLTPGPYLHIGGDESNATKLPSYIYFEKRIQDMVRSVGKTGIGWDEISKADLEAGAVVQYWSNAQNAVKGVQKGAKVIYSPSANAYMDMKYNEETELGLRWAGYIEVDKGYNWDPAGLIPGIEKEKILGIEAPLWTETITNVAEMEYMVFPRLPGYAEIGWSCPDHRNWEEYKERLALHGIRFKALGINYYPSKLVPW